MATLSHTPPAAPPRRETPRIQLARLAAEAALAQRGVAGLDGGATQQHTTFADAERLPGVVVVADGGGFAVDLYLQAEPTDLHELSGRVVGAVRRAAAGQGDASATLGDVHVTFTDLVLPSRGSGA